MLYDIPGFEGLYQISEEGRVFGIKRQRFLKVRLNQDGYPKVVLWIEGKPHDRVVHRLVAETFYGPPVEPKILALHNDGDKLNSHKSNIRWGTPKENMQDKIAHGNDTWGTKKSCVRGHDYLPDNLYISPGDGSRSCKICRLEANRRMQLKKKEAK